ncbi:MAG TPA: ABC transporter ATP-binding protein [Bacteroidales bacterium]|nr:ABC transporter ATP-binding protein [Bacteroidales bacterium]
MLELKEISVKVGSFFLKNICFKVNNGDYFVLLGSSGSGKSILLETIAGIQNSINGSILLNDKDITFEKIQNRKIGIVFQDYALFPHLSVFENVAFSLRQKHMSKKSIKDQVSLVCRELEIEHLLHRNIKGLSGGEMQRVALARTLAMKPEVLLLDEPLSALDAKLRWETRMLLRRLNKQGQTIVHVTHDYEEALVLASTVAVMEKGEIKQVSSPVEVFQNPKSTFVASLIGIKNYFRAVSFPPENETKSSRVVIEDNVSVCINASLQKGNGVVIIGGNEIVLSLEKQQTSMVNNFEGVVKDIIHTAVGVEVLVDIGILLYVTITKESLEKLSIEIGKRFWVGFKASSVRFISD